MESKRKKFLNLGECFNKKVLSFEHPYNIKRKRIALISSLLSATSVKYGGRINIVDNLENQSNAMHFRK